MNQWQSHHSLSALSQSPYLTAFVGILGVLALFPVKDEAMVEECFRNTGLAAAAAITGVCPWCSIGDIAMGDNVVPAVAFECCLCTHGPSAPLPPLAL